MISGRASYEAKRLRELSRALRIQRQLERHDRLDRGAIRALGPVRGGCRPGQGRPAQSPAGQWRDDLMADFQGWVTDPRIRLEEVQAHLERLEQGDGYYRGRYRVAATADVGLVKVLRLEATTPVPELVTALNRFQPEHLHACPSIAAFARG